MSVVATTTLLPWQVLSEQCRGLWRQLLAELTARYPDTNHGRTLRRLATLAAWLPQEEIAAVALEALPTLVARMQETAEPELRVQRLSDCLRLIQEASGDYAQTQAWLRECCRRLLIESAEEKVPRLAHCFALLQRESISTAVNEQGALLQCVVALQADAALLLYEQTSRQALVVLDLLRVSSWEPLFLESQGLGRACRRLQALLALSHAGALVDEWCGYQIDLCSAHLCRSPLVRGTLRACCLWLWRLHYQMLNDEAVPESIETVLPASLLVALRDFGAALAPVLVSEAMLKRGYELAVVASQLKCGGTAATLRCVHACLARHWFAGLPLSVEVSVLLRELVRALTEAPDSTALLINLWRLSALWPRATRDDLAIALADGGGAAAGSVRLDTVPVLLAAGLRTLTSVRREWFTSRKSYAVKRSALRRELLLLERGAAAVKVRNVERYCTQLLEFLLKLDLQRECEVFPSDLLWRAHHHLVQLLDAAAAWWEAVPDAVLVKELLEYDHAVANAATAWSVAEPTADEREEHWARFCRQLTDHVQSFAAVLQIRMRLDIAERSLACPFEQLVALHAALLPLLRFLLLDFSLSLEMRRVRHLPLAGCLWLRLLDEHDALSVELRDDSARDPPPREQWQELQHRVRKSGVVELRCLETPLGRCFTLKLAADVTP